MIVHKEHITLLAAGVSAFAAAVVMVLTRTLAKDNRLLRKAGTEPEVVAYLLPDEQHINVFNLVVTNVGRGVACNVELEFLGDADQLCKSGVRMLARQTRPLTLPWLPQDERFVQIFANILDFDGKPLPSFDINVHFANSAGEKKTTLSRISLADFDGLSRVRGADQEAADALKQIAKSIDSWSAGRLKVETVTAAEVARDQQARYEEMLTRRKNKLAVQPSDNME